MKTINQNDTYKHVQDDPYKNNTGEKKHARKGHFRHLNNGTVIWIKPKLVKEE